MEFFDNLPVLLKTFWFIALPVSLIFIIQTIMTFAGADADDGISADFDGDLNDGHAPFQIFSLRNLINFMLGFSWSGISFYQSFNNKGLLIAFALVIGCAFVMVFFLIIRQVQKLSENNSFSISETIGKTAEVYLTIPAQKEGKGKVLVSVKGSIHELDAISEHDSIRTGSVVLIERVESNKILIVKPL